MLPNLTIRAAFVQALEAIPGLPEILYENVERKLSPKSPYLIFWHRPAPSVSASIGPQSQTRYSGFFQVDVTVPKDTSTNTAYTIADTICTSIPRGSKLSYDGKEVLIFAAYFDIIETLEDRFVLHVTFRYQADI